MSDVARKVVRQSGVYSLGSVAVKAAGLLLAPILLNPSFLSVSDYGYLALLLVTAQLCILIFGVGIATGLLRFYSDPDFEPGRGRLPFTALVATSVIASVAGSILYMLAGPVLSSLLLDEVASRPLIGLMLVYVVIKVVGGVSMMHLRVTDRPGSYASLVAVEMVVLVSSAYYLLVRREMGLEGALLSYVIAAAAPAALATTLMLRRVELRLDATIIRPLIRYGSPLVIATLAGWLLNMGDRYMLKWLSDTRVLGLYDFGSRVGGVVNLVFVQSFQLAFAVIGLRQFDEGKLDLHRASFRHYTVWTGWFVLALAVAAGDGMAVLVRLFGVDPYYMRIDQIVLPVAAGFWLYGIYQVAANVLYGLKRTQLIARYVLYAAILNLVLNYYLIPPLGAMGAALATTVSFGTLAVGTVIVTERLRPIGFDVRLVPIVATVVLALWLTSELLDPLRPGVRITLRFVLVLAYVPLLLASRAFGVSDFLRGLRFVRRGDGSGED